MLRKYCSCQLHIHTAALLRDLDWAGAVVASPRRVPHLSTSLYGHASIQGPTGNERADRAQALLVGSAARNTDCSPAMQVTVKTLVTKDVPQTFEVDPAETVSSFRKRLAQQLPYQGSCKFLSSGVKHSVQAISSWQLT